MCVNNPIVVVGYVCETDLTLTLTVALTLTRTLTLIVAVGYTRKTDSLLICVN